jgi:hypothetical protein
MRVQLEGSTEVFYQRRNCVALTGRRTTLAEGSAYSQNSPFFKFLSCFQSVTQMSSSCSHFPIPSPLTAANSWIIGYYTDLCSAEAKTGFFFVVL